MATRTLAFGAIVVGNLASLSFLLANQQASSHSPASAVVDKYCSLEANGANFSASNPNAKAIWKLLVNEDEAAYDESVLIKSYEIGKVAGVGAGMDVEVTYIDLGTIGGEFHVTNHKRSERVTFHLTKVGGEWKIDGRRTPPHISRNWMLFSLRDQLPRAQKSGTRDPALKDAIDQITRW